MPMYWPVAAALPPGVGPPAGVTGDVQFNNAGAFGASSNLFWDNTNSRLGIGTSSPSAALTLTHADQAILFDQGVTARCRITQPLASTTLDVACNAYYDGTNWQRDDITQGASMIGQSPASLALYTVASGANPIAWATPFVMTLSNGSFTMLGAAPTCLIQSSTADYVILQYKNPNRTWNAAIDATGDYFIYDATATTTRVFIDTSGHVGIGTTVPTVSGTGKIHCSGDTARITDTSRTPANSAAPGNDGEICFDSGFVYIHMGGSWRRAALSTF